jgi:16S rRNA (uracil1498-N3)-methyltransferase
MVVRPRRPASLPTFVCADPFASGQTITLGEDDAHHMRVRRLELGSRVMIVDGQGTRGEGELVRLAKRYATVTVATAGKEAPPPATHLMVPVADRERVLWLAEKAAELGATSWRPVVFRRSRSVAPRGEGPMFRQKVAARMTAALEQSGGAWLPVIYPDAKLERAIAAAPKGVRFVLDPRGDALSALMVRELASQRDAAPPIILCAGPEGGLEPDERTLLAEAGFRPASLGRVTLRFETAAIAALAIVRSALDAHANPPRSAPEDESDG